MSHQSRVIQTLVLTSQGGGQVSVPLDETPVIDYDDSLGIVAMAVNFLRCGHPAVQLLVDLNCFREETARERTICCLVLLKQPAIEEFEVSEFETDEDRTMGKLAVTRQKLGQ